VAGSLGVKASLEAFASTLTQTSNQMQNPSKKRLET
jgi:hypothetical protein